MGLRTRFGGIETSLLLHGDPVVVGARLVTERVLSGLRVVELGDEELDGDVLSGTERGQGLAIDRFEVEGGDLRGFRNLLGNAEIAELGPSVGLVVQGSFAVDHDVSELEVSGRPRVLDGGGEGVPKDLAHGFEQELSDDVIVLGLDIEGGMLVADEFDSGAESTKVVNVGGVGEDSAGEGAGLVAVDLVGGVEDGIQLGVCGEHVLVEDAGDGVAMLLNHRHSGLDDVSLFLGETHCLMWICLPRTDRSGRINEAESMKREQSQRMILGNVRGKAP